MSDPHAGTLVLFLCRDNAILGPTAEAPQSLGTRPVPGPERGIERALREIEARVKLLASLPIDSIDRLAAARRLAEIEATAGSP